MRFKYLKLWLRWHWLPYSENTPFYYSMRWLCFEIYFDKPIKTYNDSKDTDKPTTESTIQNPYTYSDSFTGAIPKEKK